MEEVLGWFAMIFIGGAIVITVVGFILWVLFAILARIFSFVLLYWVVSFIVSIIIGIARGVMIPVRVLTGKGKAPFWQLRPDDVVEGRAIPGKPAGPNREYGWDSAWPNYLPYQALQDGRAVGRETALITSGYWSWIREKVAAKGPGTAPITTSGKAVVAARATTRWVPRAFWYMLMLPIYIGWWLGVWVSVLAWVALMALVGGLTVFVQQVVLWGYRLFDVLTRRRKKASLKCTKCYGESTLPGYRCSKKGCDVVHWTTLPGPLGLFTRRCSCGTRLPNTVRGAAAKLGTVCPFCGSDVTAGSGLRHTIQIPVIGSIGAGKSRLLDAATVELSSVIKGLGGKVTPLDDSAGAFLEAAGDRMRQHAMTPKTPDGDTPVGLPFVVQHGKAVVEAQIMDVAGEAFATWETSANLRYLDNADALLFVLDPLGIPDVNDQFRRSRFAREVLVAVGDQEEAYGAPIDRMRADQVPINRRDLGVVLTKGDILQQLPIAKKLAEPTSETVRDWLIEVGCDLLVRRFEKDFRSVTYFLVDSMTPRDQDDSMNPWWVLDWVMHTSGTAVRPGEARRAAVKAAEAAAAAKAAREAAATAAAAASAQQNELKTKV